MGIFAYFAICVLWGMSSVAIKLGLQHIELFTFNFFRFFFTSILLLTYNILSQKSIRVKKQDLKIIFFSATLMFFLTSSFVSGATERLDAGVVSIMMALVPMVMVVMESILEKRLLVGSIGLVGILGGICGIGIISLGGGAGLNIDMTGLLLVGAGVTCWASGSMYLRRKRIETSMSVLLLYQALTPSLYYGLILLFRGGPSFEFNSLSFGGVLYMSVGDTIIGTACYVYLLKRWKTSLVSTYAYMNPIVGLFGAYLMLGESISHQKVQGMAIILISVFLIQSDESLKQKIHELVHRKKEKVG